MDLCFPPSPCSARTDGARPFTQRQGQLINGTGPPAEARRQSYAGRTDDDERRMKKRNTAPPEVRTGQRRQVGEATSPGTMPSTKLQGAPKRRGKR
uniref:Uncharacterized protein n=1 Tax=Trichuris muris TaxID=70415 RepID=A0A5S6QQ77_TRIMR